MPVVGAIIARIIKVVATVAACIAVARATA
jgi:hypothetical protein